MIIRGNDLLVRSRPTKGLLGGMTEVPTSDWLAAQDDKAALEQAPALKGVARWHRRLGVVTHVFTHFPLELLVYATRLRAAAPPPAGMRFVPVEGLHEEALPNVMRKVVALAVRELGNAALSPPPSRRATGHATHRSK